ncbi:HupE/UreJ family protein [Pseudoduganella sp. OTU4001]|uniref:HupE/UreJ family protein n=1 Tax=Pseudoduganella sp. OTU4001 TaxID=3043854 RepID=UPI00313DB74C
MVLLKAWRWLAALLLLALPAAHAHLMPGGQGGLRLVGDSAYLTVSIPVAALAGFDDNGNGLIDAAEINAHRSMISAQLSAMFEVRSNGQPGRVLFEDMLLSHPEQGEREFVLLRRYQWGAPVTAPHVTVHLFHADATAGQRLALQVVRGAETQVAVLTRERNAHQFFAGPWAVFQDYFALGAEHILLGPDHLLFLLTVLVAGASWRYWLLVVTSFTVAHAITLALSALGYFRAPPALVEPLIAASIVLLALDNLWRGAAATRHRSWLVFGCGLLHGLGISTVLVEMGLSDGNRTLSLLAFNLGVEAGQVAFVAGALLLLALAGRTLDPHWRARLVTAASMVAAAVGALWLVQRLV